ncbi:U6 snRNA-associated Sm-like protein LSm8 [Coccomyxa sp. Obi]|nr:U6 snRNA-associated Sm-like protein LSm8 [Coccomyxa sp. Obi]
MGTNVGLAPMVDSTISVITNDGRVIVGILRGYDQATNLILDECHERVYSSKTGVEQVVLGGLHIVRGDNIAVVGEVDDEIDQGLNLSATQAAPLGPVQH